MTVKHRGKPENLRPWGKGISGNPNGRPRNEECVTPLLRQLMAANPEKLAAKWLAGKHGGTGAQRVAAALARKAMSGDMAAIIQVLNRLDGLPKQALEHSGPGGESLRGQTLINVVSPVAAEHVRQVIEGVGTEPPALESGE